MLIEQLIQIVFKIDFSKLFDVKNLIKNIFGETQHKTVTQIYRKTNQRNKRKQKKNKKKKNKTNKQKKTQIKTKQKT